ncbi:MAG: 1-acyl-sn-glycerol-3-phosphate acyltransferase [Clostridia bacterium]|nr:1-acyl-sn-glycerol-3-phosphate acyltransferase [Clostridia bacterium]
MLYVIAKYLLAGPLLWLVFRPKILNYERLRFKGGAIVISNHFCIMDPILIAAISPRWIHFMAKKEAFKSKLADFFLRRMLFAFPVDRNNVDVTSLKYAMTILKSGRVFGIFPEGRRSPTGTMDQFEKGAAFLSLKSGLPIIPIYSDPQVMRRCKITMAVGEAIDPKEATSGRKGKPLDVLTQVMQDRMTELKKKVEDNR